MNIYNVYLQWIFTMYVYNVYLPDVFTIYLQYNIVNIYIEIF
jgi:hypothetical protein